MFFRKSRPTGNDNTPDESQLTVIARDTLFEGAIESDGDVRIDGHFRGTVTARSCVVGDNGLAEGGISADEVLVAGRVNGPIRGHHVRLQAGAQVQGDVHNQSLSMESGAQLNGAVWQTDDPLGQRPGQRSLSEPPAAAALFGEFWPDRSQDNDRPLTAVRPRR